MPNHVLNKITFRNKKDWEEVSRMCKTENTCFDFNMLIPTPDNIYQGNLDSEKKEKYGDKNWYDWNCENWGTKWNAYNVELNQEYLTIYFRTAWVLPQPIVNALADKFPYIGFLWNWADEDIGYNSGKIIRNPFKSPVITANKPESQEAFKTATEIHGLPCSLTMDKDGIYHRHDCDNCPHPC